VTDRRSDRRSVRQNLS